jgi:hypothetical protein
MGTSSPPRRLPQILAALVARSMAALAMSVGANVQAQGPQRYEAIEKFVGSSSYGALIVDTVIQTEIELKVKQSQLWALHKPSGVYVRIEDKPGSPNWWKDVPEQARRSAGKDLELFARSLPSKAEVGAELSRQGRALAGESIKRVATADDLDLEHMVRDLSEGDKNATGPFGGAKNGKPRPPPDLTEAVRQTLQIVLLLVKIPIVIDVIIDVVTNPEVVGPENGAHAKKARQQQSKAKAEQAARERQSEREAAAAGKAAGADRPEKATGPATGRGAGTRPSENRGSPKKSESPTKTEPPQREPPQRERHPDLPGPFKG